MAELESFTRAARSVSLSPSSVSGRVARLEAKLGVTLLARSTRQVALTGHGRRLRDEADRIVRSLGALVAEFRAGSDEPLRQVRLATTGGIATLALPGIIRSFHARHPAVSVRVEDLPLDDAIEAVKHGGCDVGLLGLYEARGDVQFRELFTDTCVAIAQRDHPLAAQGAIDLAQLLSEPLLLSAANPALGRLIDAEAARRGLRVRRAAEAMRVQNTATLLGMAAAGLGIAVSPGRLVPADFGSITCTLALSDWAVHPRYGLALEAGRMPAAATRLFCDHVEAMVAAAGGQWPPAAGR